MVTWLARGLLLVVLMLTGARPLCAAPAEAVPASPPAPALQNPAPAIGVPPSATMSLHFTALAGCSGV